MRMCAAQQLADATRLAAVVNCVYQSATLATAFAL